MEENFGPANMFLKAKFLAKFLKAAISWQHFELLEISIGYSFSSTNYHHSREIFYMNWCQVKRSVQKTCHCKRFWLLFVSKIVKISDQSDKRIFQQSLPLSALIRILRRFCLFCTSAYKRPSSLI